MKVDYRSHATYVTSFHVWLTNMSRKRNRPKGRDTERGGETGGEWKPNSEREWSGRG